MASLIFNICKQKFLNGDIDLLNDSIKVVLMTGAYSPDESSDEYYSDLSNEASRTGYTAGGKLLADRSISRDDVNDWSGFCADDLIWNVITVSNVTVCVIYKDTGNPATSPLIAYIDFGYAFQKVLDDLIINWDSVGTIKLAGV